MPSEKYLLPNDPGARTLREAIAGLVGAEPKSLAQIAGELRDQRSVAQLLGDITKPHSPQRPPVYHPITSAADLAPLIRASRKRTKMTQQQFADACGVGRRFLSELENGKPSLEFDKVLKCALGAGIDLSAKPRRPL